MRHRKTIWFIVFIALFFLAVTPALAQRPAVTVTPIWRPGEQLSTVAGDIRYVDVQLMMTGNVQFWAVNFACDFSPNVLTTYVHDDGGGGTPTDPGDDVPVVTWGPEWGSDSVAVDSGSGLGYDYDAGRGKVTIRATRLGNVAPLGMNGTDYNLLVATIRLQVVDLGTSLVNTSASVRCNPLEYYNRDGNVVVKGRQGRVANLVVRSGYSISGSALLQAARNHAGIEVSCDSGSGPIVATTDTRGNFSFGGSGVPIREFGEYDCVFVSPIEGASPGDMSEFLDASTRVLLNFPTQSLLPVILKGGNVDPTSADSQNDVDSDDLFQFTTNWMPGTVPNAYEGLDVNGDKRINEADLAIFAGNYDDPGSNTNVDASHLLFGLATDYGGTFPNSRVQWGDTQAGPVQKLVDPRRERDFWPTMSPDGENFAYIEHLSRSGQYMLFTSPTNRPRGRALLNARSFTNDALAPSWSPDGQRIAFICSWAPQNESDASGYQYNEGNVCVVNADGSNLQQVATHSKIYLPAWFDNNVILYAGLADHPVTNCQDNICFVDLATNNSGPVSAGLLGDGDDIADMPAMTSYNGGVPVLMYRFWSGADNAIMAHEVSYDGASFTVGGGTTAITSPNSIDYYDVSPFMDIVFTEYTLLGGVFATLDIFHNRTFNVDGTPALSDGWSVGASHTVDGFVGNPTAAVGFSAGSPWNGSLNTATLFHAERATVEWIP